MSLSTAAPTKSQPKTPPSRPGHFFLGVLPEFNRKSIDLFVEAVREQGDVVHLKFVFNNNYLVSHPDGIQHVLQLNNRNYRRQPFGNDLIKMVTGLNLFTSDGDYWLDQRRLMQPAFHRRRITGFGKVMTDSTLRTLRRWESAIQQESPLDMHAEMMRLTMEIVGRAMFSVDLTDETSLLGKAFLTSTGYINYRFTKPFHWPLFIPTRRNRALKKAMVDVRKILEEMIAERHRMGEQKDDLMAMLMEARDEETGKGMTDEQLRAELGVIIGAGQETTSNALTWTFALLDKHPEIQERLLTELDTALGGRVPTIDDLSKIPYTRMVIEESMRIYPPAWAVSTREALAEDEILGYRIPSGAGVMIIPYVVHRDPRFWEKPEVFDPERFSEERAANRHKYAYIPFGAGPRKCIGNTFALVEAQLILATVLQRYRVRVQPDYEIVPEAVFSLRVKGGLPVYVEPR